MIIPSIDIMDGKAVQLKQGKEKMLEREDVFALAAEFSKYGELAVIDLDAALGKGGNETLIKQLCMQYPCRVGGGIRTEDKARQLLKAGAKKLIIGTQATPDFLSLFPKEKLIVALDAKQGTVVDKGWTNSTAETPLERAKHLEPYCSEFLYTIVDNEGMMQGTNIGAIQELTTSTKNRITAAGGICTVAEIKALETMNVNSQLGMAIYTGKLSLADAFVGVLDFEKGRGYIPTIVKNEGGNVLMLAYSTLESVQKTFSSGNAWYFSRSRQKLWAKGESSGNVQKLVTARYDCDRDALLFVVEQKNVACHTGKYSCFDDDGRNTLQELYMVLQDRLQNPKAGSYTSTLLSDEKNIHEKLLEEVQEVVTAPNRENLVWEAGDVLFFLTCLLAKKGVSIKEVFDELEGRRKE